MGKAYKDISRLGLLLKVFKNGKMVERYHSKSKRRFYNHVRTINWEDGGIKVYLRVSYGKHFSNPGKLESFWNDGVYDNKKDFNLALKAFCED